MEVLKFIFSSFWIWLGLVIILTIIVSGLVNIVKIIVLGVMGSTKKTNCNISKEKVMNNISKLGE